MNVEIIQSDDDSGTIVFKSKLIEKELRQMKAKSIKF